MTKGPGRFDQGNGWSDPGVQGVLPFVGRVRKPLRKSIIRLADWRGSDHGLATRKSRFIPSFTFPSISLLSGSPLNLAVLATVYREKRPVEGISVVRDHFVTCLPCFCLNLSAGDVLATSQHKSADSHCLVLGRYLLTL